MQLLESMKMSNYQKREFSGKKRNFTNSHGNFKDKRNSQPNSSKEKQINVVYEENGDKKEEYIGNILFDIMFGITQDHIEKINLRSQGLAINVCADLIVALENRLKNQNIPIKKRIYLNSKFFNNQRPHQSNQKKDPLEPQILSFLDATYYFDNLNT